MLLKTSDDETIHRVAAGAIANLAMNETNQELIMNQGGISLLSMTAANGEDPQTLRMVAGAIANICGNEKLQSKLRAEGGIKALLGMVRCGHPDVLAQVACGIANFAKCESRASTQGGPKMEAYRWCAMWRMIFRNPLKRSLNRTLQKKEMLSLCNQSKGMLSLTNKRKQILSLFTKSKVMLSLGFRVVQTAQILTTLPGHKASVNCTQWLPSNKFAFKAKGFDRHYLLSGVAGGAIILWEYSVPEGKVQRKMEVASIYFIKHVMHILLHQRSVAGLTESMARSTGCSLA